jgi:adenine-specific DNA-methyltransferase
VGSAVISKPSRSKALGQFFTPEKVARTLVSWVVRNSRDRLLDPSCGDGVFLACHKRSVGIEVDPENATLAKVRAPGSLIHEADFFTWASNTQERFEVAAGNPPFIRYQHFAGDTRLRALDLCFQLGAQFSNLTSSWAPFLIATASLLKPDGRMGFVVPAEIGHTTYAKPLLEWLCDHFRQVRIVAFKEKLFPQLSEDAWLLYCAGYGGSTRAIYLNTADQFTSSPQPPTFARMVDLPSWRTSGCKLRRFLLPDELRGAYEDVGSRAGVARFSSLAHAGIGYVTGANDFFHLRPSDVARLGIPNSCLRVAVRKSEQLPDKVVDESVVDRWVRRDEPILLLSLSKNQDVPQSVKHYLSTAEASRAKEAYKCRVREPWYVVPDVKTPDAFLSYMSGDRPRLVRNATGCVNTNSVHAVVLKGGASIQQIQDGWEHPLSQLSCEVEGHPLGGGMLKLEPGEAANVRIPLSSLDVSAVELGLLEDALVEMRSWRHHA